MSIYRRGLPADIADIPIQVANSFVTQDATETPQVSPLTVTAAVSTITVPKNAIRLYLIANCDILISELAAMSRYDLILGSQRDIIACGDTTKRIYVRTDTANSGSLYFRFEIV